MATSNYHVARAPEQAPFDWIRHGIRDFRRGPALSLTYGLPFAAVCTGVSLLAVNASWYTLAYLTALLATGPFLASRLYTASRELNRGRIPTVVETLNVVRERKMYVAMFSLLLALVMAAWVRFSALVLALKVNTLSLSSDTFLRAFASADGWMALLFAAAVGALLATVVFMMSAVAIPLILDRGVDFVTAIRTSFRAVSLNRGAMAVWAASIVLLTAVGIATAFVGFAVIFPVLGYGTWHSDRALLG